MQRRAKTDPAPGDTPSVPQKIKPAGRLRKKQNLAMIFDWSDCSGVTYALAQDLERSVRSPVIRETQRQISLFESAVTH
jgi:hypothetical protein